MRIIKRNGNTQSLSFDKILYRIKKLSLDKNIGNQLSNIDIDSLVQEVISNIYDNIKTSEIDELSAILASGKNSKHPEYSEIASRIIISNMHKNTTECFSDCMEQLYNNTGENNINVPLVSKELIDIVRNNKEKLDFCLDYSRDYLFDYFGYKTLERSYLLKIYVGNSNFKVVERPQHMWLRVALGIHSSNIDKVLETYNLLSTFQFTHATPTLFNSGTKTQQMSSCVDGETEILTQNRGPVKIRDINLGDLVITHKGNIKPVTQKHLNPIGDRVMYELSVHSSVPIKITGNHPVWGYTTEDPEERWINVENITPNTYISIPKRLTNNNTCMNIDFVYFMVEFIDYFRSEKGIEVTYSYSNEKIYIKYENLSDNTISTETVKRYLEFDDTTCKFIGVFYNIAKFDADNYSIKFEIKETYHLAVFNMISYTLKDMTTDTIVSNIPSINKLVVLYSKFLVFVFRDLFYKNYKKSLNACFWKFSDNQYYSFMGGFLSREDYISPCGFYKCSSEEVNLIKDIHNLSRFFGVTSKLKFRVTSSFQYATLGIPTILEIYDNMIIKSNIVRKELLVASNSVTNFMKISYIKATVSTDVVYNIGVEDDHSYCANGIIIKNCFLIGIEDSMEGIYKCLSDCALISKYAGGIGVHVSNIRGNGSYIKGTNGKSDGIVKMLKVFNDTARFANQGSKRNGSFAIYLEPWHSDIEEFLELRKNSGDENLRARDLFYALWICDKFMDAVGKDSDWYLMTPNVSEGLTDVYGEEFNELYERYIKENKYVRKVKARDLWNKILVSQIETGMPYMLYKDSINKKSNQKNIGVIKSSNLCVSGDTKILTDKGYYSIGKLQDKEVNLWNGIEFSKVTVRKTGVNKKLINLKFSNGVDIKCTPEHKFYIKDREEYIQAGDIRKFEHAIIDTDMPVIKERSFEDQGYVSKNKVPINSTLQEKIKWLSNLLSVTSNLKIKCKDTLKDIGLLLNTIGCNGFDISHNYLMFSSKDLIKLRDFGINTEKLLYNDKELVVTEITMCKNREDTFCFTEPKRNMGIFNGIIAGNCAEITLVSNTEETAVCNISTVSLKKFVIDRDNYDYKKLYDTVKVMVANMNKIIDRNFYSTENAKNSNLTHRPIAIGVQGFANTLFAMDIPFESERATDLNKKIFETIQYAGWTKSMELAKESKFYDTYPGSPISKGIFQHNMWGLSNSDLSGMWDWDQLKKNILLYGVRNSMITSLPPTASTSQILGNYESFEPPVSNIFMRSTSSGDFPVVNKYLIEKLIELNIWSDDIKDQIIINNGSIQNITEIPKHIRDIYKTVWEISQKSLINLSLDRAVFIDQTQSLNIYMESPTISKLSSMHFYSWKNGAKTGMYYLRSKAKSTAQKFSVERSKQDNTPEEVLACSIENKDSCVMCSG